MFGLNEREKRAYEIQTEPVKHDKNVALGKKLEELLKEKYNNNVLLYYYYNYLKEFGVIPTSLKEILEGQDFMYIQQQLKELAFAISNPNKGSK